MTRIKVLRQERGETQESLAALIGITRGAYANIENGKREPDIKTMAILANHFEVTIDYLLGREAAEKTPTPVAESEPIRNIIRIAGRDGSFVERELTDEQAALMRTMLDQLKPIDDMNV